MDTIASAAAVSALLIAFAAVALTLRESATDPSRTCRAIGRLRADLVVVLRSVENVSTGALRQQGAAPARVAQARDFYDAQIRQIQPRGCT